MTTHRAVTPLQMARNAVLTLASIAAAFSSYAVYAHDRTARIPAQSFAENFTLTVRSPEIVESLQYAPSPDFANDLVADATLRDVIVPVNLTGLPADVRAAWLDAVARRDEQTAAAQRLALDAVAERPGWPYHAQLLGHLVYARSSRNLSSDLHARPVMWSLPMLRAAEAAPADRLQWQSLALAYLETWPTMAGLHTRTAPSVFRHAFDDAVFVRLALGPALQMAGRETILPLLPDSPSALREAFRQLAGSGDVEPAWQLQRRWDAVEWAARTADLRLIEKAAKRGDVERVRRFCSAWASEHSVWDYDSPAAHAQAARVLELWPAGTHGAWASDPRANIARYLLSGRWTGASSAPLNVVSELERVPEPVQAEAELLAGDFAESWRVATAAPDFGASNDWTGYLVAAVNHLTASGRTDTAREVLGRMPPTLKGGCSEQTMRAMIVRSDAAPAASDEEMLFLDEPTPVCATVAQRSTYTLPPVARPVIADVIYDGARRTTLLLQPSVTQRIAFAHQPGAHTLLVRTAAH